DVCSSDLRRGGCRAPAPSPCRLPGGVPYWQARRSASGSVAVTQARARATFRAPVTSRSGRSPSPGRTTRTSSPTPGLLSADAPSRNVTGAPSSPLWRRLTASGPRRPPAPGTGQPTRAADRVLLLGARGCRGVLDGTRGAPVAGGDPGVGTGRVLGRPGLHHEPPQPGHEGRGSGHGERPQGDPEGPPGAPGAGAGAATRSARAA